MTVQEQQMIDDLVDRIRNTNLSDKDPDAEQHLQQGLASYPDAIYVLAQTVLVQKYGLEQAQQKIQDMQAELDQLHQQPKPHGSFLGNLLGLNDQPPPPPQYPQPYPPQAYPPTAYTQPVYAVPQSGGFLRGAMQTAAGVAMGEIAFQGMESLFHGFGGGGGYGYGGRPEEIINNNYYGDSNEHEHRGIDSNDSSFYNPNNDASRDATGDASQDNLAASDDDPGFSSDGGSGDDFSSSDDFSSGDDSGSSDGGF